MDMTRTAVAALAVKNIIQRLVSQGMTVGLGQYSD
jgi:hypothetical protein